MPCLPNATEPAPLSRRQVLRAAGAATLCLAGGLSPAWAASASIQNVRFELTQDAVRMTGNVRFALSDGVQEILSKGVPLYFVFSTNTVQERWYWSNRQVHKRQRYMRLAYQPLTRKWRVNFSTEPFNRSGVTGVVVNQNYDTLQQALNVIQRISNWEVLPSADWDKDAGFAVDVSFQLDISQLQRPLQIGTSSQADWNIEARRSFRLNQQELVTPGG